MSGDTKRLKQLTKLSRHKDAKMSAKQSNELTRLRAKEKISTQDMSQETMLKIRDYLEPMKKLGCLTKADQVRLEIIKQRLSA